MKVKKLKCHVLMVSKIFPAHHLKAGNPTNFARKIIEGTKIHTIRNSKTWIKKTEEVQQGKAYISVREWEGKPYHSRQIEICQLHKEDNVGVEVYTPLSNPHLISLLAKNDGLELSDFACWFKNHLSITEHVIIHFTGFRYNQRIQNFTEQIFPSDEQITEMADNRYSDQFSPKKRYGYIKGMQDFRDKILNNPPNQSIIKLMTECQNRNFHCSVAHQRSTDFSIEIYRGYKKSYQGLFYTDGHISVNTALKEAFYFLSNEDRQVSI